MCACFGQSFGQARPFSVVFLALTHSCVSFIFLTYFIASCIPLLLPWRLPKYVMNTMYMRASKTQGMYKVGMQGQESRELQERIRRKEERMGGRFRSYIKLSFFSICMQYCKGAPLLEEVNKHSCSIVCTLNSSWHDHML